MKRVVITGLGTVNPVANDMKMTWQKLLEGKSGVSTIKKFETDSLSVKIAGEVKDFDPSSILDRKDMRRMDPYIQLAIYAAAEAIADSGIDLEKMDKFRTGAIISSGIGGNLTWEEQHKALLNKGPDKVSPFFIPMMIINMASGIVAIRFGLKGPNYSVSSACASSGHAIVSALRIIQRGEADVMITGGSESSITPLSVAGFSVMKALSTRNDDPETASRPFDMERDGFVMSEGAALLVLEEYERALERGANIYCEIVGAGQTDDAFHITAPDETAEGPAMSMKNAIKDAGVSADEIDHVNAHGTSTPYNDKIETKAIKIALGNRAEKIPVVSTKSMTGHMLGAGSAVEAAVVSLSLKNQIVHPTINLKNPDPECDLDYVTEGKRNTQMKYALSNSFGFGGHNVSILFKKYEGS
ncbi:beta-ketoacyl-ACP synthase II [candidate division WOR-3 bacterium]|nr:beta-ketoacyl-ACP synthase II [candidate division WOR-3 bacterium]